MEIEELQGDTADINGKHKTEMGIAEAERETGESRGREKQTQQSKPQGTETGTSQEKEPVIPVHTNAPRESAVFTPPAQSAGN